MATGRGSAQDTREAGSRIVVVALRAQFDRLAVAVASIESEIRIEDIHAARVAARRLRSLLKTFRPILDPRRTRSRRIALRRLAHALDSVREADVRADLLSRLATRVDDPACTTPRQLADDLEKSRDDARAALRARMSGPGWQALRNAISNRAVDRLAETLAPADLPSVLKLVRVPWRRALRLAARDLTAPDELHELRLALKHCRYAVEALADLDRRSTRHLLRRLRACQDSIGDHRDAELALQWLEQRPCSPDRGFDRRLRKALQARKSDRIRQTGRRVGKLKPAYDKWWTAVRKLSRGGRRGPPSP